MASSGRVEGGENGCGANVSPISERAEVDKLTRCSS